MLHSWTVAWLRLVDIGPQGLAAHCCGSLFSLVGPPFEGVFTALLLCVG